MDGRVILAVRPQLKMRDYTLMCGSSVITDDELANLHLFRQRFMKEMYNVKKTNSG